MSIVVSHNCTYCIEVNAPFKILCTLIRCIDNEATAKTVKPKDVLEAAQELLKVKSGADERLDTEEEPDRIPAPKVSKKLDNVLAVSLQHKTSRWKWITSKKRRRLKIMKRQ